MLSRRCGQSTNQEQGNGAGKEAGQARAIMSNLIRALAAARQALIDLAVSLFIVMGATLLIGGFAYRIFLRPDLTSPEALEALWPFFGFADATLTSSCESQLEIR